MGTNKLGDQELSLLRFVADRGSATVGEIVTGYAEPRGLARSTIETVLERLRKKGFLSRTKQEGAFRYQSTQVPQDLMGGIVQQFVEGTLGGSLVPFLTYFTKQNRLSEEETAELERMLQKLEREREVR